VGSFSENCLWSWSFVFEAGLVGKQRFFVAWIHEFYNDFQIDWMNSWKLQLLHSSLDMICGLQKLYGQTIKGFSCHEHFVVSSPSYHINLSPINQPLDYQSFDTGRVRELGNKITRSEKVGRLDKMCFC